MKNELPADLTHMIEFQSVIVDMQSTVIDMRKRNASQEVIEKACVRIDKLISIYERFDKLYFNVNFHIQKNYALQKEIMALNEKVLELKAENEKLLKSMEWETIK